MSVRKDIVRQASMFTMGGLIDPRLLEPAKKVSTTNRKATTKNGLQQFLDKLFTNRLSTK